MMISKLKSLNNHYPLASRFILIIVLVVLCIVTPNLINKTVHAEDNISNLTSQNELTSTGQIKSTITYANGKEYQQIYGIAVNPISTTVEMSDWILRKGDELISILQTIAQPFCLLFFIVGCFMCLIGTVTKRAGAGLTTMISSALIYAAILYASVFVNIGVNFIAS